MPMYRKKPVEVEARQVPQPDDLSTVPPGMQSLAEWSGGDASIDAVFGPCIFINTLEGQMRAEPGDWIIKGTAGEFYPCKPSIFARIYELLPDATFSEV